MTSTSRWADLGPRVASAVVMLAVAGVSIGMGGLVFNAVIAAVVGGIIWELVAMFWPGQGMRALKLGGIAAISFLVATFVPVYLAVFALALPVLLLCLEDNGARAKSLAPFAVWIMAAGFGFVWLRNAMDVNWLFWLVSVVVATDVAGYFAGKVIGGRKFWPRISPKKTWSGTSAGWVAAALVGVAFTCALDHGALLLVVLSVLISMASQAGDIAESALKRRRKVKDSSAIIPGHGGLFDRFDGMLGASALFLVLLVMVSA